MITRGPDNYTCITYKKKLEILEKCYARTTTILNTAETLERKTMYRIYNSCTPNKQDPSLVLSGHRKIITRESNVPMENEACRVSHWKDGAPEACNCSTNERFFFSHILLNSFYG